MCSSGLRRSRALPCGGSAQSAAEPACSVGCGSLRSGTTATVPACTLATAVADSSAWRTVVGGSRPLVSHSSGWIQHLASQLRRLHDQRPPRHSLEPRPVAHRRPPARPCACSRQPHPRCGWPHAAWCPRQGSVGRLLPMASDLRQQPCAAAAPRLAGLPLDGQ